MESSAERVFTAVDELSRSLGGRARAARLAGRNQRFLDRPTRLRLDVWHDLLDAWRVDPLRLWAWTHAVYRFERDGALAQSCADAAELAKRRAEPLSAQAVRLAYLRGELDEQPSPPDDLAQLARLDELRYTDPSRAARRAERMATSATSAETAARALGCWASALRLVRTEPRRLPARLRRAHVLLWTALRMAAAARCDLVVADGLQRAVYVTSDRTADFDQSLRLARAMSAIYDRQGPDFQDGRGRALVTLGYVFYNAGNYSDASVSLRRSTRLLAMDSSRYRVAAFQGLAFSAARLGNLSAAERWSSELDRCSVDDPATLAKVSWLRARMAQLRGDLMEASRLYLRTVELLGAPVEAAFAVAEATQVLAEVNRFDDVQTLVRGVAWAVAPLESEIPAAAAALADLVQASQGARRAALLTATRRLIAAIGARGPLVVAKS